MAIVSTQIKTCNNKEQGGATSVPFVIFQTRFIMFPGGPHSFLF